MRRWLHDPRVILAPFVSEGMVVLEPGPGMGFFTLELARRAGPKGRVLAIDVQPKMLAGLTKRAAKAGLSERIEARLPKGDQLGLEDYAGRVDFALAFAVVHEVSNPARMFVEIRHALKPGGRLLFVEPAGHVQGEAFEISVNQARDAGMLVEGRPGIRRSHTAVLVRPGGVSR
jgi:ubiquinone/menaquinone biosynthesis C-methylase UbiE